MAKILIVDDAAFMRRILRDILTKNGYSDLAEAVDGLDGVQKFQELHPDLVILNITMPNMNGLDALREIHRIDSRANVIICSAMGQESVVIEAVRGGAKDFIVKPFKPDRLIRAVGSVIGADAV